MFDAQEAPVNKTDSSERSVGKTSNLKHFQKGVSGNPGGRKKTDDIRSLARLHTKPAFNRIIQLIDSDDERVAFAAAKEVIDRAYGKAKPMDDEDAANKKSLTINIIKYTEAIDGHNGGHKPTVQLEAQTVSVRTLETP